MNKKLHTISKIGLLLFAVTLLLSSCTEEKYYEDPSIETTWHTEYIDVSSSQWQWDNVDKCFYYEYKNFKKLHADLAEHGAVLAATLLNGTYRPLAFTEYYGDYSETFNYEYGVEFIRFNVTASDLFGNAVEDYKPLSYSFKVTLIY